MNKMASVQGVRFQQLQEIYILNVKQEPTDEELIEENCAQGIFEVEYRFFNVLLKALESPYII